MDVHVVLKRIESEEFGREKRSQGKAERYLALSFDKVKKKT